MMFRAWLVILFAGCGGPERVEPPSPPSLAVIKHGAEPRQLVSYQLAPGEQRVTLQTKLRAGASFSNRVAAHGGGSVELPTTKVDATVTVTAVEPDGTATIATAIEQASALDDGDPQLRERFAAALAATHGVHGVWHLRPDGRTTDLRFAADGATPGTKEQLERISATLTQLAVVLPGEPIGVGATWKVTSTFTTGPIAWTSTATYRLIELADATATIHADLAARAGHQTLMSQPNASSELTSGELYASSDIVVDRHRAIATGSTHGTTELGFEIHQHGLHERSVSRIETSSTLTAR